MGDRMPADDDQVELVDEVLRQVPAQWTGEMVENFCQVVLAAQGMGYERVNDVWDKLDVLPDYLWAMAIAGYADGLEPPTSEDRQSMLKSGVLEANLQTKTVAGDGATLQVNWPSGSTGLVLEIHSHNKTMNQASKAVARHRAGRGDDTLSL